MLSHSAFLSHTAGAFRRTYIYILSSRLFCVSLCASYSSSSSNRIQRSQAHGCLGCLGFRGAETPRTDRSNPLAVVRRPVTAPLCRLW